MLKRYILVGFLLISALVLPVALIRQLRPKAIYGQDQGKWKGPINAPVWIREFSDFQCPACREATQALDEIWGRYPGKTRLFFHHFPLRSHFWAQTAHQAAECANRQGKFWPYHDLLYARQKDWIGLRNAQTAFKAYAWELGLDRDQFSNCLDQNRTRQDVLDDVKRGDAERVNSTPTFFVNGRRILGGGGFKERMEAMIQEELEKLRGGYS